MALNVQDKVCFMTMIFLYNDFQLSCLKKTARFYQSPVIIFIFISSTCQRPGCVMALCPLYIHAFIHPSVFYSNISAETTVLFSSKIHRYAPWVDPCQIPPRSFDPLANMGFVGVAYFPQWHRMKYLEIFSETIIFFSIFSRFKCYNL